MTKTHTPLIIEGKIYVMERNTKYPAQYPVRPEHEEYWKNRIGKAITDVSFEYDGDISIAIPPQQKQGDVSEAALTAVEELLIKHRSIFDGLDIPHDQKKALLLHFNYSTQY